MDDFTALQRFVGSLRDDPQIGPSLAAYNYIPPVPPRFGTIRVRDELKSVLESKGVERFYTHQTEGIDLIREGKNVVVMTPTASGKSLIYHIPVIESVLADPDSSALYIFPLKGLEQDQVNHLNELFNGCMGPQERHTRGRAMQRAEVYDGDTSPYWRKKIKERLPPVIFTNPDMIHLALNPFHRKWGSFFRSLKYVVVDEIHTYRGVFGSNVSHVFRRLRRICNYWGSSPQFIACSATIANPKELAEALTGLPFSVVDRTGAPRSGSHFLFMDPFDSPYTHATRLFLAAISKGLRTILFTKARKITELIYRWSTERAPLLAGRISPYRAGFLPSERRDIERRLFGGELLGVITTSALELGVDIGGLDVCILCGYPGSVASSWQRAGRVGRHGQEALIVMIALKDALDHYFISHPESFFERPHEASICDPANRNILKQHLLCAADEIHLRRDDKVYDIHQAIGIVDEMVNEGSLKTGRTGDIWFSARRSPQTEVGIRSIGRPLKLRDGAGRHIGDLDGRRIYREAFPGAVYLHKGRQYEVLTLDLARNEALCREVDVLYYTKALSRENIDVIGQNPVPEGTVLGKGDVALHEGLLRITYTVTGYEKRHLYDGTRLSRHSVEMPDYVFNTEGIWMFIHRGLADSIMGHGYDLPGTLHAAEHVTISCIPLFALCDKGDIGGLSHALHPDFGMPIIFIYDGVEGGVGLTRRVLDVPGKWIESAVEIIGQCECEEGCPSCVQDSQCGSANQPLDKRGALYFLKRLLSYPRSSINPENG